MLDKLLRDHAMMRDKGEALIRLLDQDVSPERDLLADTRWQLSSVVMQHLAFEDRYVYSKLLNDDRPAVADVGRMFQADLAELFSNFAEHAQYWTPDLIDKDWDGFRFKARGFVLGMYARIDREEQELFPLATNAAIDVSSAAAPANNWARDAFAIKDAITSGLEVRRMAG